MGMDWLLKPDPDMNYGAIVACQAIGCAACVVLLALQCLAAQPGLDLPSVAWAKDSGWWLVPAPFFPTLAYYSALWRRSREGVVEAGAGAEDKKQR